MEVDFAFLCDAATESAGKVYALGVGIDRLQARELPAHHGRLTLVTRLSFAAAEAGTHPFAIRFVSADGESIIPDVIGEMNVAVGGDAPHGKANVLVDLVNAEFTAYGPHEVTLSIDGTDVATVPLDVAPLS